jgi:hypothetical protein
MSVPMKTLISEVWFAINDAMMMVQEDSRGEWLINGGDQYLYWDEEGVLIVEYGDDKVERYKLDITLTKEE